MDALSTLSTYFKAGGPFMFIILTVGVLMLAIILERMWVIGRASTLNGRRFAADLEAHVSNGDVNAAVELARKVKTPAGHVALQALFAGSSDPGRVQESVDGAAAVVLPPLARRLPHLTMLANVATLLGLLGTIFGLTTAFSAVSAADPAQRSALLAAGISQALNTTSFGLIVAVPALICHGMLVARVEGVVNQVDEIGTRLGSAFLRLRTGSTMPGSKREAA
jgi:biopolymer transport protein ExbB/TolQ